jgi:hypothetical protein
MYWNYRITDENDNTITYADSLVVAQSEAVRLAMESRNGVIGVDSIALEWNLFAVVAMNSRTLGIAAESVPVTFVAI